MQPRGKLVHTKFPGELLGFSVCICNYSLVIFVGEGRLCCHHIKPQFSANCQFFNRGIFPPWNLAAKSLFSSMTASQTLNELLAMRQLVPGQTHKQHGGQIYSHRGLLFTLTMKSPFCIKCFGSWNKALRLRLPIFHQCRISEGCLPSNQEGRHSPFKTLCVVWHAQPDGISTASGGFPKPVFQLPMVLPIFISLLSCPIIFSCDHSLDFNPNSS